MLICINNDIDQMFLQSVSNHPVHILNNDGGFSPSSFIPFCSFGEKLLGTKIENFDIPVCDIFKPTNYLDQLCYETSLQDLKTGNKKIIGKQLEMGLTLVLDYNEERQSYNPIEKKEANPIKALYNADDEVSIYLDTISLFHFSAKVCF